MAPAVASERWFDGTWWDLPLPDGWTQVYGCKRMTFRGAPPNHELSFGVRKAVAGTREETTLESARTMALNEALSLRSDPGSLRPLVVGGLQRSIRVLDAARPLKLTAVNLQCLAKGARIVAVTAGVLNGHVLQTTDGELVRSRGNLRFADWRIFVAMTRPRKETVQSNWSAIDVLSRLQFHDPQGDTTDKSGSKHD